MKLVKNLDITKTSYSDLSPTVLFCTALYWETTPMTAVNQVRGGGTLGIFGWGYAAGNLEPFAYTTAGSAALLLLYTRLTPPPPSPLS